MIFDLNTIIHVICGTGSNQIEKLHHPRKRIQYDWTWQKLNLNNEFLYNIDKWKTFLRSIPTSKTSVSIENIWESTQVTAHI